MVRMMTAEGELGPRPPPMTDAGPVFSATDEGGYGFTTESSRASRSKRWGLTYLESLFSYVNYDLLISKTFYFFFFSAFGSLFPLMAIYFKQLGMNACQCGLLMGCRPFIEFFSPQFWGGLADRWQKGKQFLLFALFCWVAFTIGLAFVHPTPNSCIKFNQSAIVLVEPWSYEKSGRNKRSLDVEYDHYWRSIGQNDSMPPTGVASSRQKRELSKNWDAYQAPSYLPHPEIKVLGMSPLSLDAEEIQNMNAEEVKGLVSPPYSTVVYRSRDVNSVFVLILFLVVFGEFFSAPAITLADSATLGYLGDNTENYGRQRMMGSFGWALSMFIIGIALDYSNVFPDHPCGHSQLGERNYTVCFAFFSVLMSCAFITALLFRFNYGGKNSAIPLSEIKDKAKQTMQGVQSKIQVAMGKSPMPEEQAPPPPGVSEQEPWDPYAQQKTSTGATGDQNGIPRSESQEKKIHITLDHEDQTMPHIYGPTKNMDEALDTVNQPNPYIPRGKPGQTGTLPEWLEVLKMFGTPHYAALLYMTWYLGFGIGLVFTFLFWHLQDLGGTPTLFGIASVINHVSEVCAYFYCKKLILAIGHVRVLYVGLLGNIARFLYISYLSQPWWVLPFELIQGLTHAACWAAACSYITQATPPHQRSTAQGVLQGIHHGLGRGCGSLIGGVLIYYFGSEYTFRGYGFCSVVVLGGYFCLNYFMKEKGIKMHEAGDEPLDILEESAHLAPCGVPMNPMARNLSSSRLSDIANQDGNSYGSTGQNGLLDPAAGTAKYVQPPAGGGGGGTTGFSRGDTGFGGDWGSNQQSVGYAGGNQGQSNYTGPDPWGAQNVGTNRGQQDSDIIRNNFQAYHEVTSSLCDHHPKIFSHTLVLSHPRHSNKVLHMLQPTTKHSFGTDVETEEYF